MTQQQTRKEIVKSAIRGHAPAQFTLGRAYYHGCFGWLVNQSRAKYYLNMAARGGHCGAQLFLATWLLRDDETEDKNANHPNVSWAIKLLTQAFEDHGSSYAAFRLGWCYFHGRGVTSNRGRAVSFFEWAAYKGLADAQFALGQCLAAGNGITRNETSAKEWFTRAASQGLAMAQVALGICFAKGRGTRGGLVDLVQAVTWFRAAAKQGNKEGEFNLGHCYYHGNGVVKDRKRATQLWERAKQKGSRHAWHALQIKQQLQ